MHWSLLKKAAINELAAYHLSYPLRQGMPREELRSRLKLAPHSFNLVFGKMASDDLLTEGSNWAALPDHKVEFSPFQRVKVDKLMGLFAVTPFTPPSVKECLVHVGEDVFSTLRESGAIVVVSEDIVFRKEDYQSMVEKIRQLLLQKNRVSMAEVRDLLNSSRKYVQPLLEHMDATGLTVRDGDTRRLKNQE